MKQIYEQIVADERYLRNIEYGEPRRGHAEGKVRNHILELEQNLDVLSQHFALPDETYWKLKVLINVHDSFKAEAKRDAAIEDAQSHASIAATYLVGFIADLDLRRIVQYHDVGFAVYKKWQNTQRMDEERLMRCLGPIIDKNLFVMFAIIDTCTKSKGRDMIRWMVNWMQEHYQTAIGTEAIDLLPESSAAPEVF